jgi:hypothetical protein
MSYKRIYLLGLIPVSFLLTLAARSSSYFAEQLYAKHIYKWISQIISSITGLLPFSVAELLVVVLPVVALVILISFTFRMIVDKNNRKERVMKGILNILCTGSIVIFSFLILGGLNYYRYPFGAYSNLEIIESSVEELYALTESLAIEANVLRTQIPQTDENGVFQLSLGNYDLAKIADEAYELLSEEYPVLGGHYGAPKPILLSKLMSTTEITGIFFPFTMEANVNVDVPDYTIPATMLHELAHLRGFMREDEANFLAYLAGMKSEQIEFRYSSTMSALIVSGNALYDQDVDLYFQIRELYSEDVLKDIRDNSAYWQQYEDTVISTVSNQINDTYLKANAQTDGVKSYGRMLDLLLAKYRKDHEE